MSSISALMAIKVLSIIVFGAVFFWWQMRDLAQEKKRASERDVAKADTAS